MLEHLAEGYSAAEAARLALARPLSVGAAAGPSDVELEVGQRALAVALDTYDDAGANAALDRLLAAFGLDTVLAEVVLPYLHELGERWSREEASVAQEHFASNVLRGRLLGLARGWGQGTGPRALLACAPRELHDLPLVIFGLALRARGWRVTFLGPDTPVETVADAAHALDPGLIVLSGSSPDVLADVSQGVRRLAARWPVALAGAGATQALARQTGARLLADDPVVAADRVAAGLEPDPVAA